MLLTNEAVEKMMEEQGKNVEISNEFDEINYRSFRFSFYIPSVNSLILPSTLSEIKADELSGIEVKHLFIPKTVTRLERLAIRASNVYFEGDGNIEKYSKTEFFQGNDHDEAYAFDFHRGGCSAQDDRYEKVTYNSIDYGKEYYNVSLEDFKKLIK